MRQDRYRVTFDRDFEGVIAACAGRRQNRWHLTWLTPRMMRVYAEAFDAGHTHSYEVWNKAGKLVGGGFGTAYGVGFTGDSQFAHESNASKIGLAVLCWHLAHWGFKFFDGKLIGPFVGKCRLQGNSAAGISRASGQGRAAAGKNRPLAGRDRPRNRVALAA